MPNLKYEEFLDAYEKNEAERRKEPCSKSDCEWNRYLELDKRKFYASYEVVILLLNIKKISLKWEDELKHMVYHYDFSMIDRIARLYLNDIKKVINKDEGIKDGKTNSSREA